MRGQSVSICGLLLIFLSFWLKCSSWRGRVSGQLNQTFSLRVNASQGGRPIPPNLFGIFFEEINHAGAGGLWAELVDNRGFEAGGPNTPSNIAPWSIIGDETEVWLETDRSSCFARNPIALRIEVLCDICPLGGVGVYNPGFWGMDIVADNKYKVVLWISSTDYINMSVAFTSSDGTVTLARTYLIVDAFKSRDWSMQEIVMVANATDHYARLGITSTKKGVYWIDQVSAMPVDTYNGHGFRKDLALMLEDLKPRFIRFPGGCYVEGGWLRNAFRWRQSIGPWEERPGHFGDVWGYWSDDGIGYFEFLQLAEDLKASPVWVFNNGISHTDEVASSVIEPFIQDILDGIEFARGSSDSRWGSVRATMGHPEPFELQYVAIGNEDCGKQYYRGNYLKFFAAIKNTYPDMKIISNCDGSSKPLDHPADLYDFHIYTSAANLFAMSHQFDNTFRAGPKAFVSEYAVTGHDAGKGSLLAALAEGAFLIGLEQNSDVVELASYAPLFVNNNNRRWNPDAIVFDSWQSYGTPSYWVQHFFKHSSGAVLFPVDITGGDASHVLVASALQRHDQETDSELLVIKAVNFGADLLRLIIAIDGLPSDAIDSASTMTVLTSRTVMDENSFDQPNMVVPKTNKLLNAGISMDVVLPPYSVVALDMQLVTKLHQNM
eukprot:c23140_g1_i1 orf=470-2455(+)